MQTHSAFQRFPWAGTLALASSLGAAALILQAYPPTLAALTQPWYLNRAAGLVAYTLLWAAVVTGLLQSSGLLKGKVSPAATVYFHDFLASLSLWAATLHGVVLLWDRYVPFTVPEILMPFRSHYQPFLVGIGTLAFYMALGVTVTTYFQAKFRPHTWRRIHQTSLAAYVLVLVHGLILGTDTNWIAVRILYAITSGSLTLLAVYRFLHGKQQQAPQNSPSN